MSNLQKSNCHPKKKRPKLAKRKFSLKKGLWSTYTPYWSLTSRKIPKKINVPILSNTSQKWPKMAKICKTRIFVKTGFTLNLYPLIVSNFILRELGAVEYAIQWLQKLIDMCLPFKKSLVTCSESMSVCQIFAKMAKIRLPYGKKTKLSKIWWIIYGWIGNLMLVTFHNRNMVWK